MMSPAGRYTIPVNYVGYSIFILVFEVVGSSNTVLQGLYLLRRKEYHYGAAASCFQSELCLAAYNLSCKYRPALPVSQLMPFKNYVLWTILSLVPCSAQREWAAAAVAPLPRARHAALLP